MAAATLSITLPRQGIEFDGYTLTCTDPDDADAPIALDAAECIMVDAQRNKIHNFAPTISGAGSNVITLTAYSAAVSATFPAGTYYATIVTTRTSNGARKPWVDVTFSISGFIAQ